MSVDRPVIRPQCELWEILRNWQPKEYWEPNNKDVACHIHVCELQNGKSSSHCFKTQQTKDQLFPSLHGLKCTEHHKIRILLNTKLVIVIERYSPTIPKVIQRIAATMGCGMAARIPPNFPAQKKMMSQSIISLLDNISVFPSRKKISISNSACQRHSPKIEKKIMKTAEIWITLRLPTRVNPISPTFSLQNQQI